jgi:hypothetical protein
MNATVHQAKKEGFTLKKEDLNIFLKLLEDYGEIIGPVKDEEWIRMKPIKMAEEMTFEGISWFTSKNIYSRKSRLSSHSMGLS